MCSGANRLAIRMSVFVVFCGLLLSGIAIGQDEEVPKADAFIGYQWLNPGGTVPTPFGTPNHPISQRLKSIPQGLGGSVTYNFNKFFGLEADYGVNFNKFANETNGSVGP